jgi:enolase
MNIRHVYAYEIFDSRGLPTIQCCIELDNGIKAYGSAPSGASVGSAEALELRDNHSQRLMGKGVLQAIHYINTIIAQKLVGYPINALAMDNILMDLDHDPFKKNIGANTTIAVSIALFKAQAIAEKKEVYEIIKRVSGTQKVAMPIPMFNVINGGAHANNNLCVQEFMVVPQAGSYIEQLHAGVTFYQTLKKYLHEHNESTNIGDEGGFAPNFTRDEEALKLLHHITTLIPEHTYQFALDIAASELYHQVENTYHLLGYETLTAQALTDIYQSWCQKYPLISIEDGMAEDDIQGWQYLTAKLGHAVQLIGDDLFVTNPMKIRKGILQKTANAVLIKPNQIGTVSQTLAAIEVCKNKNLKTIISHRSGETNDTFICDLAVGTAANFIKAGAPARGERIAKYNRLLDIARMLHA